MSAHALIALFWTVKETSMPNPDDGSAFLPIRSEERAMTAEEAWDVLSSRSVQYGFLGTHGLDEEGRFPYVVPMNFAADPSAGALYLHSTDDRASKRRRAIGRNAKVSFTVVDPGSSILPDPQGRPCKFTMQYRSVMVFGRIEAVASAEERGRLFNFLMQQKAPSPRLDEVRPQDVEGVAVWRLRVEHVSGKRGA